MSISETNDVDVVLKDEYGFSVEATPQGELRVVEPVRLLGAGFSGTTFDLNFWTTTAESGGNVTQVGGEAILSTGTSANGTVQVQSNTLARYIAGASNRYRTIRRFGDTGTTNNTRRWGAFTSANGYFFQLSNTKLSVNARKSGTDISVSARVFNVNKDFVFDTNYHSWEIYYSNKRVYYVIDDVLRHVTTATNTSLCATLNLPIRVENNNTNDLASNITSYALTTSIYRLGKISTESVYTHFSSAVNTCLKFGAGKLHSVIVNNTGGTGDVLVLYDNTSASGSVIGNVSLGKYTMPTTLSYGTGLPFSNGLYAVTSGTTDFTMMYE
jgi:hypothetical protein